jgi:para-aminobenzoate synthetase component 1
VQARSLRVHAGCGIVADSDPQAEAEELGWKLQPLLQAVSGDGPEDSPAMRQPPA